MRDKRCGCRLCYWYVPGPDDGWSPYWNASPYVVPNSGYCPRCADRLNADGTVTPKREWIAEEIDTRRVAFDYMDGLLDSMKARGDHGMAAAVESAISTMEYAMDL